MTPTLHLSEPSDRPLTGRFRPDGRPVGLDEYRAAGGYAALQRVVRDMEPAEVTRMIRESGLEGRGGAGFSTGRKWGFMPPLEETPQPRYVVANADEMEPGAFKDRILMERDPHLLIEGLALAAYAGAAQVGYIFIRAEYQAVAEVLQRAVDEARAAGYLGERVFGSSFGLDVRIHLSAGRYICGEASATLNALEGERPVPRHKPPHQTSSGLWSKPTVVNNVESLCAAPAIVAHGAEWYRSLGRDGQAGTKLYSVSGRVENAGAWELPLGVGLRTLLEEHAGGMKAGLRLRAVLPGGSSTPFVLARDVDVAMHDEALHGVGSRLGTGTVVVLDDHTCPVGLLQNLQAFYAQESCGWCVPCWQGLTWVRQLLATIEQGEGTEDDLGLLHMHAELIREERTFCDLATGAMQPLRSGLEHFADDFRRHLVDRACPWLGSSRRWG